MQGHVKRALTAAGFAEDGLVGADADFLATGDGARDDDGQGSIGVGSLDQAAHIGHSNCVTAGSASRASVLGAVAHRTGITSLACLESCADVGTGSSGGSRTEQGKDGQEGHVDGCWRREESVEENVVTETGRCLVLVREELLRAAEWPSL